MIAVVLLISLLHRYVDAEILADREIMAGFADLLELASYGYTSQERAAFVVRGEEGKRRGWLRSSHHL